MSDNDAMRREFDRLSDEELTRILRDWDPEEWRPEVLDLVSSILESRGISTREILAGAGDENENDSAEAHPPDTRTLVTVTEYFSEIDAHPDRMALEQAGIRAWIILPNLGEGSGAGMGVRLQVQAADLTAAMEILEAPPAPDSVMPPEILDLCCPLCGSNNVVESDEVLDVLQPTSATSATSERRAWLYRCSSCGHGWSE